MYYNEVYVSNNKLTYGNSNQPIIILDRAIPNVREIRYIKSQIPKTYYSINSFNNVFRFQEEIGASFSASVVSGNYTVAEFISALKTSMDTNSTNGRVYTITYSDITNKISISINAGTFAVLGADALSLGHLLVGFPASNSAQSASHTGSLIQRVSTFPEELFIRGSFGQNTKSQVEGSSTSNNIFIKIDTGNVAKNENIVDINNQEDSFLSDTIIDSIESYITYNDINNPAISRIVDFNGGHFSYVVGLWNKLE